MSDWRARWEGRECVTCGRRRGIFTIHTWQPPRDGWHRERYPEGFHSALAHCLDRDACVARKVKRETRGRLRSSRLQVWQPPGDEAKRALSGHCGWCGEPMFRVNKHGARVLDTTRGFHRAERGERDCRTEVDRSYAFKGDRALRLLAMWCKEALICADCGRQCDPGGDPDASPERCPWEADHELALEDGGEHTMENLRVRCVPCHSRKTARENATRRAAPDVARSTALR